MPGESSGLEMKVKSRSQAPLLQVTGCKSSQVCNPAHKASILCFPY